MANDSKNQGEGNREADREYRQRTRDFVESGKVEKAAEDAKKQDADEAQKAEETGKKRARELDPQVHRDPHESTKAND